MCNCSITFLRIFKIKFDMLYSKFLETFQHPPLRHLTNNWLWIRYCTTVINYTDLTFKLYNVLIPKDGLSVHSITSQYSKHKFRFFIFMRNLFFYYFLLVPLSNRTTILLCGLVLMNDITINILNPDNIGFLRLF